METSTNCKQIMGLDHELVAVKCKFLHGLLTNQPQEIHLILLIKEGKAKTVP